MGGRFMSESSAGVGSKEVFTPDKVWGLFMVLTIIYGYALTAAEHGAGALGVVVSGLITIYTSPALLVHDYFAMAGVGAAFINSAMAGLLSLGAFKFAKLPIGGLQMGAFGLVMGFALLGKNPVNMFPILLGAYLYSLFKKEPYKNHVTMAAFSTCLAPVVSQPPHIPQVVNAIGHAGAVIMGALLGVLIGFVINSMAGFIKKSHEGLNLYNIGWGAGLISIALTVIYNAMGIEAFGPGITPGYSIVGIRGNAAFYNPQLYAYMWGMAIFFFAVGFLSGGRLSKLSEILHMKSDDNLFYNKYGKSHTYLAMGFLSLLALAITLIFRVNLGAGVLGAIISMVGWGGFGKAVANCAAIIAGVMLGGLARYLLAPGFLGQITVLEYFSTQSVIWTSAFWGTCLSPMAKYFGWKWALLIGMVHFAFAFSVAPFHWGQNLYNNGLAAGFVCVVMIPFIRSIDKKGKYPPKPV